jgi:hypothetical protein
MLSAMLLDSRTIAEALMGNQLFSDSFPQTRVIRRLVSD